MNTIQLRLAAAVLFFMILFLSGFWLKQSGKPYPMILMAVHKLSGLSAAVLLVVIVYRIHQAVALGPWEITVITVTLLLYISNIVSGGMLSTEKIMPAIIQKIHKFTAYPIVLATVLTLYLLRSHK